MNPELRIIEVPPSAIAYDCAATVAQGRVVVMVRAGLSPAARLEAEQEGRRIAAGMLTKIGGAR